MLYGVFTVGRTFRIDFVSWNVRDLCITGSDKHNPFWAANSHSASQEILSLLYVSKFHYRVHKDSPLVLNLSQVNLVHTIITCSFNIRFTFSLLGLPSDISHIFHYLILLDLIDEEHRFWNSLCIFPASCYFLLAQNILLSTLFSKA
jgi:hypothetical protein